MSDMNIAAMAEAVMDDPEIQERLLDLCHAALDEAEYLLKYGTPEQRAPLTKSLVAMMTRPKPQDKGVDEVANLRAMLLAENDRMIGYMVGDAIEAASVEAAEPQQIRVG